MPIREAYVMLLPVGFQMVFHSSEVLFSICRYRGSLTFPLENFLLVYSDIEWYVTYSVTKTTYHKSTGVFLTLELLSRAARQMAVKPLRPLLTELAPVNMLFITDIGLK